MMSRNINLVEYGIDLAIGFNKGTESLFVPSPDLFTIEVSLKKITGFQKLEIQIIAMYYFIFLNNGAFLWNGGVITPRDYVAQFTDELNAAGITAEIYSQYTEWLTKKYPLVEAIEVLERQQKIVYTFEALDPPADFIPGYPLYV